VSDYRDVNLAHWNERAAAHAASPGYGLQRFRDDPAHLSDIVRFDRPRLGDIAGLRGLHLQCHIGTDTLSLHRLGARGNPPPGRLLHHLDAARPGRRGQRVIVARHLLA